MNKRIFQTEPKLLRIPTDVRLTSWLSLHNVIEELNSGLPRTNPTSGETPEKSHTKRVQCKTQL